MSLPARLSRMAHRFFSQIVVEHESSADEQEEQDSDDVVGFVPRNEDRVLEYDTCIDISSVVEGVIEEGEDGESVDHVTGEGVDHVTRASDHVTDILSDVDGGGDVLDITSTIVNEVKERGSRVSESRVSESRDQAGASVSRDQNGDQAGPSDLTGNLAGPSDLAESATHPEHSSHVHSQTITVTQAPRLRPDLSDSEMSGISDESEVEVEVGVEVEVDNVVDTEAPLTDVINGIVRERRKQAKREARKRAKTHQKNKGFKIAKPHKKHEHNAKELEAIERQLKE